MDPYNQARTGLLPSLLLFPLSLSLSAWQEEALVILPSPKTPGIRAAQGIFFFFCEPLAFTVLFLFQFSDS